jgi:hypothetical protein
MTLSKTKFSNSSLLMPSAPGGTNVNNLFFIRSLAIVLPIPAFLTNKFQKNKMLEECRQPFSFGTDFADEINPGSRSALGKYPVDVSKIGCKFTVFN